MKNKSLVLLFMFCLILAACATSNSLRLLYKPNDPSVLPQANAPTVVVVLFEDKRTSSNLGVKKDGSPLISSTMVSEWVSRALADELGRKGLQVSFSPTVAAARNANPDFIVTGAINEVWVQETGSASYSTRISSSYSLANKQGTVYGENISANQEKTGLPGTKLAEDVLSECLRSVVTKAAQKISELCFTPK